MLTQLLIKQGEKELALRYASEAANYYRDDQSVQQLLQRVQQQQ